MSKTIKILTLFSLLCVFVSSLCFAEDMEALLKAGKAAIENDRYSEATDYMAKMLAASPDYESKDPRVIAFGSTVMAYGALKSKDPKAIALVEAYLNKAIKFDPSWQYPKRLLKKVKK